MALPPDPAAAPDPSAQPAHPDPAAGAGHGLDPETAAALSDALDSVLSEIGDDPANAELAHALSAARDLLPAPGPDPHSFDHAEQQMTARRSAAPAGPAA